jgi:hypothetical protein
MLMANPKVGRVVPVQRLSAPRSITVCSAESRVYRHCARAHHASSCPPLSHHWLGRRREVTGGISLGRKRHAASVFAESTIYPRNRHDLTTTRVQGCLFCAVAFGNIDSISDRCSTGKNSFCRSFRTEAIQAASKIGM